MSSRERDLRSPPPLPPRQTSSVSTAIASENDAPPPYELVAHQQQALEKATSSQVQEQVVAPGLERNDPRSSSQQSLAPDEGEQGGRRKLLLIYIHGFMGNETSFRSFPAHVHNLLSVLLAETHVVHTRIYPRYQSRNHITFARDGFSKWLEPHESRTTDVVLLGHSMGGLLSAEVAIMPSPSPASHPLKHRIFGTINFDVPFLGMHPGIVKSGLASIFKPSEETHEDKWGEQASQTTGEMGGVTRPGPSRTDTLYAPGKQDPNFNPAFNNDVILPVRKGWRNAWHFINKHSDDLYKSTKKLVSSHLEFGGAMANYGELKARYAKLRALEEPDGRVRQSVVEGGIPPRVRFVNYWTASTGRPKKPSTPGRTGSPSPPVSRPSSQASASRRSLTSSLPGSRAGTQDPTGSASCSVLAEDKKSRADPDDLTVEQWSDAMETLKIGESSQAKTEEVERTASTSSTELSALPELPPAPPPLGDLSYIHDKDTRKLVEKEHEKAVRSYEKAVKDRKKVLEAHAKREEKQKRKGEKAAEKATKPKNPIVQKPESEMTHSEKEALRLHKEKMRMEAEGRRMRGEPEPEAEPEPEPRSAPEPELEARPIPPQAMPSLESVPSTPSIAPSTAASTKTQDSSLLTPQKSGETIPAKPKKDRKFCVLPPKDSHGERDPCWVRVFMENVDEVGAHCGLFFVDERYERLVGDVAERIEGWVREARG